MVEKPDERLLPTNKVRTIMKSCGDPSAFLSKESVLVVTKAAVSINNLYGYTKYLKIISSFTKCVNNLIHNYFGFLGTVYLVLNTTNA